MKTDTPSLLLALCLALCGPADAWAATDAVVQPLEAPDSVPPGPMCALPPLEEERPAVVERDEAPSGEPDDRPLLCACLPLDVLVGSALAT
jgi:hypothetical protein